MILQEVVLLCAVGGVVIVLIVFVVRLYFMVRQINQSFAKLGFIVREDAKKYFDDASEKLIDTNKKLQDLYQEVVEVGTKRVLDESGTIMEKSISEAQNKAGQVIVGAQTDAQNILNAAKVQANKEYERALERSVDTINWTMQQYLRERFDAAEHEHLIKQIVTSYSNEHRK
jgi:F0F1-type ATP synthase membrane subunit b/b'